MKLTLEISDDNIVTLERYSQLVQEIYRDGAITAYQREEVRSYAVEFVSLFLRDNPENFPHKALIQKLYDEWKKK
jgi:hypothetical protein